MEEGKNELRRKELRELGFTEESINRIIETENTPALGSIEHFVEIQINYERLLKESEQKKKEKQDDEMKIKSEMPMWLFMIIIWVVVLVLGKAFGCNKSFKDVERQIRDGNYYYRD